MKISERLQQSFKGDTILWIVLVMLALYSLLAIYSATGVIASRAGETTTLSYLIKQIVLLLVGIFFAYCCHWIRYTRYSSIAWPLLAFSIVLLVLVLFIGNEVNGAKRWIYLFGISFQPSDLAEVALIIFLAREISSHQESIKEDKRVFWKLFLPVLVVCGLILPNNLSTAALLFVNSVTIMFIGRIPMKFIGGILAGGLAMFGLVFLLGYTIPNFSRAHTWTERITTFMDHEESYQSTTGKIAIANGGLIGRGPGNSIQKSFLPYAHTDFIFAIILEEYGFLIGGILLISIFLVLLFRCIRLVTRSPKTFGAILAIGLCLNIVIQAFANFMVTVGLVPDTGVTLPIISLGGSSLLFTCISFGIILSVSKYIENIKPVENAVQSGS
jgi:cell division protein FtsW